MKKHVKSLVQTIEKEYGRDDCLNGAEAGVWKGEMSAELLRWFPNLSLVMIDLWQSEDVSKSMHDKDSSQAAMDEALRAAASNTQEFVGRCDIRKGDSVTIAENFPPRYFHFVFLDADHFYGSVRVDLLAWFTKVKYGGIISGHDYNGMGDKRKGWGVKRAVDEFFGTIGLEVHTEPGLVWWVKKW